MFAFVSAFPKSLHCTDEAQQAETVLSAVLSVYIYIISFRYVCLSVCLKAMRFDILAPIATKLHTRTKYFRGRFLSQCRSARLIERALSEGPLFVAAMAFSTTART